MTFTLWIPGRFRLTNGMLSDLRAAGRYEGAGRKGGRPPRPGYDAFAVETKRIRTLVKSAALRDRASPLERGRVPVIVIVFGHRRFDPDAWYLAAKPAIDGLVDAGVFSSDRRHVGVTIGYVLQDEQDERTFFAASGLTEPKEPGFFVEWGEGQEGAGAGLCGMVRG